MMIKSKAKQTFPFRRAFRLRARRAWCSRKSRQTTQSFAVWWSFTKPYVVFVHDLFLSILCWPLALWIRVENTTLKNYESAQLFRQAAIYGLLCAGIFLWTRLYRGVWRYISLRDIVLIVLSISYSIILYIPLTLMYLDHISLPRSFPFLLWLLNICVLSGSRIFYRLHKDTSFFIFRRKRNAPLKKVLILGATNEAELFIRHTQRHVLPNYKIIGILDDKLSHQGLFIHGVEVIGKTQDLGRILQQTALSEVIFAYSRPNLSTLKTLLELNQRKGIEIKRLSLHTNMIKKFGTEVKTKPVSIEDLLSRPKKNLDLSSVDTLIKKQRVLILGAGGSIGSELARQVAKFGPTHLCVADHAEFSLYAIDKELGENHPKLSRSSVLCNIENLKRVLYIMNQEKPTLVFHAAALKHVLMAEQNPCEAILTNVIGTRNVAQSCKKLKVKTMVFISTDKAINPSSVVGATKKLAESYCQALNLGTEHPSPQFITVRFGNVLGSSGSVIPLFKKQIQQGGPVTVTHPEVTRYFMMISEAVELILQAVLLETKLPTSKGKIFVLDMGEPIKILTLAEQMIRLSGYQPHKDIPIQVTGLKSGEKLYEELFAPQEKKIETTVEGLFVAHPHLEENPRLIIEGLRKIEEAARAQKDKDALKILKTLVPSYRPEEFCTTETL